MFIKDPNEIPEDGLARYVRINTLNDRTYRVRANIEGDIVDVNVESVGLDGDAVGIQEGEVKLEPASKRLTFEYVDFTDEHGYKELQVHFVNPNGCDKCGGDGWVDGGHVAVSQEPCPECT